MSENENIYTQSNLYIENREKLRLTGVIDVDNFDDFNIGVKTHKGDIVISGNSLKIAKLDVESGELLVDGTINSLFYNESQTKSGSFFGRLLK